jgi:hypothetical protein
MNPNPTPTVIAKLPSRRRGVTTMNSLLPMAGSVAESRMQENLAAAERARLLRSLGHDSGLLRPLRRIAGALLVRVGEWVIPAQRSAEPVNDQALIRLAR